MAQNPAEWGQFLMQEAQQRGLQWFQPHHAAGILGNLQQESGFADDVVNFERRGDQGSAHGIMQWRGVRFENLKKFAQQKGGDPRDIRIQLSFVMEEGDPQSPYADFGSVRAFKNFPQAQTASDAAIQFIHAERPAGYDGNPMNAKDAQTRAGFAEQNVQVLGSGDNQEPFRGQQGNYDRERTYPVGNTRPTLNSDGSISRQAQPAIDPALDSFGIDPGQNFNSTFDGQSGITNPFGVPQQQANRQGSGVLGNPFQLLGQAKAAAGTTTNNPFLNGLSAAQRSRF